jgi:hypothetical protein
MPMGLLINFEESYMLQAVLILQKSKSRSVENATGNGGIVFV